MKNEKYKHIAEKLWDLLDDIDSLSDVIKPTSENGYKCFYNNAMKICKERHNHLSSDGCELKLIKEYKK
jgi:hypothetical protein